MSGEGLALRANSIPPAREWFPVDHLPTAQSATAFDANGRLRLTDDYAAWMESGDNWLADCVGLVASGNLTTLRVLYPAPGTVFYLDPDLPESARYITLQTSGGSHCRWESESLTFTHTNGQPQALLTEGRHQLTVHSPTTGVRAATWLVVRRL